MFAEAGAEGIVLASRRVDKLKETAAKVESISNGKTKTLVAQVDLDKDVDVAKMFRKALDTFGRSPDLVLANAGVVENAKIGELSTDDFWTVMVLR